MSASFLAAPASFLATGVSLEYKGYNDVGGVKRDMDGGNDMDTGFTVNVVFGEDPRVPTGEEGDCFAAFSVWDSQ